MTPPREKKTAREMKLLRGGLRRKRKQVKRVTRKITPENRTPQATQPSSIPLHSKTKGKVRNLKRVDNTENALKVDLEEPSKRETSPKGPSKSKSNEADVANRRCFTTSVRSAHSRRASSCSTSHSGCACSDCYERALKDISAYTTQDLLDSADEKELWNARDSNSRQRWSCSQRQQQNSTVTSRPRRLCKRKRAARQLCSRSKSKRQSHRKASRATKASGKGTQASRNKVTRRLSGSEERSRTGAARHVQNCNIARSPYDERGGSDDYLPAETIATMPTGSRLMDRVKRYAKQYLKNGQDSHQDFDTFMMRDGKFNGVYSADQTDNGLGNWHGGMQWRAGKGYQASVEAQEKQIHDALDLEERFFM